MRAVNVADEVHKSAAVGEDFVVAGAFVVEFECQVRVEERQLAQSLCDAFVLEGDGRKNRRVWKEVYGCSCRFCFPYHFHWSDRLAAFIALLKDFPIALDRCNEPLGECVHAGYPYTV
ncbi:hypothetical protein HRbin20_01024 [bacterium HR20]|nr:hypothetical protein HRbin20_01024 [bacterium HR20]